MAKRKKKRRKQKPTALVSSWLADLLLAIASGVITATLLKALNFEKKERGRATGSAPLLLYTDSFVNTICKGG